MVATARVRVEKVLGVSLQWVQAPASSLGVIVSTTPGSSSTGRKIPAGDAVTMAKARSSLFAAVLDGPMFTDTGATSRFRFRLLDEFARVDSAGREPDHGATLSVDVSGRAVVLPGDRITDGATVAVQCYPVLAADGVAKTVANTKSNNERVWRAALVLLRSGEVAFVVGVGALPAFARAVAAMDGGTLWAGYTDGGSSTELRTERQRWGFSRPVSVLTWLALFASLPGGAPPRPPVGGNAPKGSLLAPAAAVGAVLWWLFGR